MKNRRRINIILGIVLTVICINALGGGYYAMAGAKDIPIEWLASSPFTSYFIPGFFLFVVIGGLCLTGAIMAFRNSRHARALAFICSVLLLSWIFVQVRMIGFVSWLQPAIFVSALVIFCLGYLLPRTPTENRI